MFTKQAFTEEEVEAPHYFHLQVAEPELNESKKTYITAAKDTTNLHYGASMELNFCHKYNYRSKL